MMTRYLIPQEQIERNKAEATRSYSRAEETMITSNSSVIVCIKSHRARENFMRFLGRKAQSYYTSKREHQFYEVTPDEWRRFEENKKEHRTYWHGSITKARVDRSKLRKTWS